MYNHMRKIKPKPSTNRPNICICFQLPMETTVKSEIMRVDYLNIVNHVRKISMQNRDS